MGSHVFVVDKFSYPVHRSRGFCGVKNPLNVKTRHAVFADLNAIRNGDLVFFYHRRIDEPPKERGYRGIFRVISEPFVDKTDIEWKGNRVLGKCPSCEEAFSEKEAACPNCGSQLPSYSSGQNIIVTEHILSNRVLIEPLEHFEIPVDDNTAYVNRLNHGNLWSMLFRKIFGAGRERSINQILPEESNKIERLLRKLNPDGPCDFEKEAYPDSPESRQQICIQLEHNNSGVLRFESSLQAWIMGNIDKDIPVFGDFVPSSEMEYFGNWITYGIGGESVDMLVTYKDEVRYKAIPIELKRDRLQVEAIKQIYRYAYWIGQFCTANAEPPVNSLLLQPIAIGHKIPKEVLSECKKIKMEKMKIPYPEHPCEVTINPPILLAYRVSDGAIKFEKKFGSL